MGLSLNKRIVVIKLKEKLLGTVPKDPEIFSSYVQEQQ